MSSLFCKRDYSFEGFTALARREAAQISRIRLLRERARQDDPVDILIAAVGSLIRWSVAIGNFYLIRPNEGRDATNALEMPALKSIGVIQEQGD